MCTALHASSRVIKSGYCCIPKCYIEDRARSFEMLRHSDVYNCERMLEDHLISKEKGPVNKNSTSQ